MVGTVGSTDQGWSEPSEVPIKGGRYRRCCRFSTRQAAPRGAGASYGSIVREEAKEPAAPPPLQVRATEEQIEALEARVAAMRGAPADAVSTSEARVREQQARRSLKPRAENPLKPRAANPLKTRAESSRISARTAAGSRLPKYVLVPLA